MILIFGYSKLAAEIASQLKAADYEFAVIEPINETLTFARKDQYTKNIYNYECFNDEELLSFGIDTNNVQMLFCVHNEFNRNLFVTLSARNLNHNLKIISLANDLNEEKKLHMAGASVILNPSETTGLRIFRQLDKPISLSILDGILNGNSGLLVKEIPVMPNSILDGKLTKEMDEFKRFNLILLGIQDKEMGKEFIFSSRGINHKLDVGDIAVVLGRSYEIEEFEKFIEKSELE